MNPTLKFSLGILGGAAISSGITWFVTKKILDRKYLHTMISMREENMAIHKELVGATSRLDAFEYAAEKYLTADARRDFYDIVNEVLSEGIPETANDEEEEMEDEGYNITSDIELVGANGVPGRREAAYYEEPPRSIHDIVAAHIRHFGYEEEENGCLEPDKEWDPEEPDEEELYPERFGYSEPVNSALIQNHPYVITQDECGDTGNDIECLVYYDGDGVLATESEEVLSIGDTIGEEALLRFENDLVYIRNERLGLDYEVRFEHGSYAHMVMGADYDDYPKVEKINKKKNKEGFDG